MNINILEYYMLKSIDIVIPTYNRKKFEKLIEHNINCQSYPFINKILIADDGDDDPLCINTKYPIEYYRIPRCTIGAKRNFLCSQSKADFIAFMDTDDFYNPEYISNSIFNLIANDKQVSGSSDMLIFHNHLYVQRCMYSDLLNEATFVFKRSYFNSHKFSESNSSEGHLFLSNSIKDIYETPITDIMVCICHDENTIDKRAWLRDDAIIKLDMGLYDNHFKILSTII